MKRSPWSAVVRLAVVVSAVAVAVAIALNAFGDVSQTALVIAVIVVGFVVSWIQSGRSQDDDDGSFDRLDDSASRRGAGIGSSGDRPGRTDQQRRTTGHRVAVVTTRRLTRRAV